MYSYEAGDQLGDLSSDIQGVLNWIDAQTKNVQQIAKDVQNAAQQVSTQAQKIRQAAGGAAAGAQTGYNLPVALGNITPGQWALIALAAFLLLRRR